MNRKNWEPLIFFNAGSNNATVTVNRNSTVPGKFHWQYISNFDKTKTYSLADLSSEDNYKALKYSSESTHDSVNIAFKPKQAVAVYYVPDEKDNYGYIGNISGATLITTTSTSLECYGNIMAYIGVMGSKKPELVKKCFSSMFYGCIALTKAPELPETKLTDNCYSLMFYGCTSLANAPELPATTLACRCYYSMFRDCSSLINAPELSATTLAGRCYNSMFDGCTSLVTAPELPATTLAENCYRYMFNDCASLVNAPKLPATILACGCYHFMFGNCTSLTKAPELPATTLADYCYKYMFNNCTSLKLVNIMAITSATYAFEGIFNSVTTTNGVLKVNKNKTYNISEISVPTGWTVDEA